MVKKNGREGYRSFTIVGASKTSGCRTKGYGGRFINKTAAGSARKAFTDLCRTKRIRGNCTLFVTMRDTTKGGKQHGKLYTYKLIRKKLANPMIRTPKRGNEYVIEYRSSIKSVKSHDIDDCGKQYNNMKQSRGRRRKHTAKHTFVTANNIRKKTKLMTVMSKNPVRRSKRLMNK